MLAFAYLDLVVEGQCPRVQGEAHLEMVHPISRWGWLRAYIQVFQRRLAPPGYGAPPRGAPMYGRVEPISRLSNHLQHSGELGTQEVGKTGVDGRHVVPILHLYLLHNSINCETEQIVQVVVIQIVHTYHFVLKI